MSSNEDDQPPDSFQELDESLSKGAEFARQKTTADSLDQDEERAAEFRAAQEHINDQISDRTLREKYAHRLFWFLCSYNTIVLLIVMMQGFPSCPFELSEIVLATLVGSNAIAAFGLVSTVSKGQFKNR